MSSSDTIRILRPRELAKLLSVSIPTLYRMMDDLPPKIRLSGRAVGWRSSDIDAWLDDRTEPKSITA